MDALIGFDENIPPGRIIKTILERYRWWRVRMTKSNVYTFGIRNGCIKILAQSWVNKSDLISPLSRRAPTRIWCWTSSRMYSSVTDVKKASFGGMRSFFARWARNIIFRGAEDAVPRNIIFRVTEDNDPRSDIFRAGTLKEFRRSVCEEVRNMHG